MAKVYYPDDYDEPDVTFTKDELDNPFCTMNDLNGKNDSAKRIIAANKDNIKENNIIISALQEKIRNALGVLQ